MRVNRLFSASVLFSATAVAALSLGASPAMARDNIHIVGSSTVYPFATVIAERFGRSFRYKTPTVESTGSGGGLKLFCTGVGVNTPDITNSSRRIKKTEYDTCQKNGVRDIIEVKIGYDGIVLANSVDAERMQLSRRDIFLALAKDVPDPRGRERFVSNPYRTWKDVNPKLPNKKIRVLGPPPTSGTRDAFVELALEGGCKTFQWVKELKKRNKQAYKRRCHTVREDGAYVEAGENDNLIVQKLNADKDSFGVFGFSFLKENSDKVQGSVIEGREPAFAAIASGAYPVSRSLYFYVKKAHIGQIRGIERYLRLFVSSRSIGPRGLLVERGLIPLPATELRSMQKSVHGLASLQL